MTIVHLDSTTEFDQEAWLANPWNVRQFAGCPRCGAEARHECVGTRSIRTFHSERHAAARRYLEQLLADIEKAEAIRRLRDYSAHRVREAARVLEALGVTLAADGRIAYRIYEYAGRRGEPIDDTFNEDIIGAAQRWRIRNS